jgi:serine/threonine-protein kinase
MQPAAETLHGERGTYRVFDWVGGGGFASVFFGRDLSNNRPVALKRLHPHFVHDPPTVARFEREADLVLVHGLRHPNLVRILDRGRDEQDVPFLTMEWIDGRTVADLLIQQGRAISVANAAAIGCQVLQGLGAAHALKIVHRDIKPSNLMVTAAGHVMVMDLGIAKETTPDSTSVTGVYSGIPATLQYAAPEQLAGDRPVDGRTDLYALGATLYLLLAGRPAFSGPTRPDPVPLEHLRPETDGNLAAIVKRALASEPSDRFPTAAAMLAALRPFAPADLRVVLPTSDDAGHDGIEDARGSELPLRPERKANLRSTDQLWAARSISVRSEGSGCLDELLRIRHRQQLQRSLCAAQGRRIEDAMARLQAQLGEAERHQRLCAAR